MAEMGKLRMWLRILIKNAKNKAKKSNKIALKTRSEIRDNLKLRLVDANALKRFLHTKIYINGIFGDFFELFVWKMVKYGFLKLLRVFLADFLRKFWVFWKNLCKNYESGFLKTAVALKFALISRIFGN